MGLDLKDFIGETLSQIILGIDQAKEKLQDSGKSDWVSPPIVTIGEGQVIHDHDARVQLPGRRYTKATVVHFDIAVSASEGSEGGAGAGLKVVGVEARVGGSVTAEAGSVSRIKFTVPLVLAAPPEIDDT